MKEDYVRFSKVFIRSFLPLYVLSFLLHAWTQGGCLASFSSMNSIHCGDGYSILPLIAVFISAVSSALLSLVFISARRTDFLDIKPKIGRLEKILAILSILLVMTITYLWITGSGSINSDLDSTGLEPVTESKKGCETILKHHNTSKGAEAFQAPSLCFDQSGEPIVDSLSDVEPEDTIRVNGSEYNVVN